ncbi:MAG TPA: uroporphyrinogen-III synthase, partial [Actinomycetes bacterium]|nr:uroporphyrinogen-III synthase [Actinomycetes bacterium]
MERPLEGLIVLVPRAREQAGAFSRLLRERGAEPLEVPTIAIRPLEDSADLDRAVGRLAAGCYDWVVLTSVNGVAALRARVEALGYGTAAPGRASVAAVGPATETALRDWGVRPRLVPPVATTAALGAAFPPGPGSVLLARADIASAELSRALRAKGYRTDDVAAYRTVPLRRLDADARRRLDGGQVDWVAFTASSTVRGFADAYGAPPP